MWIKELCLDLIWYVFYVSTGDCVGRGQPCVRLMENPSPSRLHGVFLLQFYQCGSVFSGGQARGHAGRTVHVQVCKIGKSSDVVVCVGGDVWLAYSSLPHLRVSFECKSDRNVFREKKTLKKGSNTMTSYFRGQMFVKKSSVFFEIWVGGPFRGIMFA